MQTQTESGTGREKAMVREYFDTGAAAFDSIYSGEKAPILRLLDRIFRKDMYQRYDLAIQECSGPEISSVLDVGTGSGRFCLALGREKKKTFGIDFSDAMIRMAQDQAARMGVTENCKFAVGDFMNMEFKEPFDALLAIGLFDYISQPDPFLAKMKTVTRKKIIATFPQMWTWRAPVRWVRLRLKNCPVFFYSEARVRSLYEKAGLKITRLERVGRIYFVVATSA